MIQEVFKHKGAFAQAVTGLDMELYEINYGVIQYSFLAKFYSKCSEYLNSAC